MREYESTSYDKGLWGESLVIEYFLRQKYFFCGARIKIFGAEVDLIFAKNEIYYFVEVKCLGERSSLEGRWPKAQKTRFLRMAKHLAELPQLESRFLFVVVHFDKTIEVFSIEEIL